MKQIPNSSIKKWAYTNSNKLSHPISVAAICPGCTLHVVFNTTRRLYDPNRDTSSCSSNCSACGSTVHFWIVDMVGHARQDGDGNPGVYMLPAPPENIDMDDYKDAIPDSVLQYCKTAQAIYFSGNLMATNVLIKTAMETIFDDFLPIGNSRSNLSMMIRDSISSINHNEPLANLSTSTKKLGDLHELFKKHHGTDRETADAMMQMLETLIIYLYVLPARFKHLEERFAKLRETSAANDAQDTDDAPGTQAATVSEDEEQNDGEDGANKAA